MPPPGHGLAGSTEGSGGAAAAFASAAHRSGPAAAGLFASLDGRPKAGEGGSSIIRGAVGSTTAHRDGRSSEISSSSGELVEVLAPVVTPVRSSGVVVVGEAVGDRLGFCLLVVVV